MEFGAFQIGVVRRNASSATASTPVSADAFTLMIVMPPNRPPEPSTVLVDATESARPVHGGTPGNVRDARRGRARHITHFDDFDVAFTRAVEDVVAPSALVPEYAKLTNGVGLAALLETTGVVQDLSNVTRPAPSAVGRMPRSRRRAPTGTS